MTKQEFLELLKSRLAVLEPAEQQDILDEYAYHIDMRVAGGLTEEQAIRDFGDLDQLVKLIYEAYHVNPDFQVPVQSQTVQPPSEPGPDQMRESEPVYPYLDPEELDDDPDRAHPHLAAADRFLYRHWQKLCQRMKAMGHWFAGLGQRAAGLFRRKPRTQKAGAPVPADRVSLLPRVGRAAHRAGRSCGQLCRVLLRLGWNTLLLLCALPFAAALLGGLIGSGLIAVLLIQGYPLLGPLLMLLGGLLCCAAILALGTNLIWRGPAAIADAQKEDHHEEHV